MNAPANVAAAGEADSLTVLASYRDRAQAIVDQVMPRGPAPHIMDVPNFIAASRREYERSLLFWRTFARLRAKAEGGEPYIAMPKGCSAVMGGAMEQVSRELAEEARFRARWAA